MAIKRKAPSAPASSKKPRIEESDPFISKTSVLSFYARARSVLRLSASINEEVLGRDIQRSQINRFLSHRLGADLLSEITNSPRIDQDESHGALYISGRPGTGKTVLVTELCQQACQFDTVRSLHLNCATLSSDEDVYFRALLAWQNTDEESGVNIEKARNLLENLATCTTKRKQPFLLVLDELDHLKNNETVLFLFELACRSASNLILIGIANALDYAALHLSSLPNMCSLDFPPYQAAEMSMIAKQRLSTLLADDEEGLPLIMPPALELASKKVAATTGDLRSFLAVLRKAIDLAEPQSKKISAPAEADSILKAAKATPTHVLKALKTCQLASSVQQPRSVVQQALESLPNLQARLVLTCLCIAIERSHLDSASQTPSIASKPKQLPTPQKTPTKKNMSPNSTDACSAEDAWAVYNEALKTAALEEMIQSRSDWEDLLDNLSVVGLVSTFYSSTTGSPSGSKKTKAGTPSPNSKRSVRMSKQLKLNQPLTNVREALKNADAGLGSEALRILSSVFDTEDRKQKRKLKVWETVETAPMSGFNGNGLEGKENLVIGTQNRGRNVDESL